MICIDWVADQRFAPCCRLSSTSIAAHFSSFVCLCDRRFDCRCDLVSLFVSPLVPPLVSLSHLFACDQRFVPVAFSPNYFFHDQMCGATCSHRSSDGIYFRYIDVYFIVPGAFLEWHAGVILYILLSSPEVAVASISCKICKHEVDDLGNIARMASVLTGRA
ncbi:unnamed protein product [Durusdinium trenchii]|uniref:Uncharacterized protein n=1 Tax=Durusdinium trenchii TaxID=1381693 RepID=A0ABP0I8Y8_9DINO